MNRILMIGGTGNVGRLTLYSMRNKIGSCTVRGCHQGDDFSTLIGDFVSSLTRLEAVVLSFHG